MHLSAKSRPDKRLIQSYLTFCYCFEVLIYLDDNAIIQIGSVINVQIAMNTPYIMFVIGALLTAFILYLNLAATVWLFKTENLNRFQKLSQSVIVWLLPYIGARFVLSLLRETDPAALPRSLLDYRAFGWLETANTRIDAWAGDHSQPTHHHENSGHGSGSGDHGC